MDNYLPKGMTCSYQLMIPTYSCYEVFSKQLLLAIQVCSDFNTDDINRRAESDLSERSWGEVRRRRDNFSSDENEGESDRGDRTFREYTESEGSNQTSEDDDTHSSGEGSTVNKNDEEEEDSSEYEDIEDDDDDDDNEDEIEVEDL